MICKAYKYYYLYGLQILWPLRPPHFMTCKAYEYYYIYGLHILWSVSSTNFTIYEVYKNYMYDLLSLQTLLSVRLTKCVICKVYEFYDQ